MVQDTDFLPRIKHAWGDRGPYCLIVEWDNGEISKIDFSELLLRSQHLCQFANDHYAFARVRPNEFGTGIEWDNGLDYSARALKMLADEQKR